jgi:hypothetical protein
MPLQFPHQPNRSFENRHDTTWLSRAMSREAVLV